jgi:hypothetical protein
MIEHGAWTPDAARRSPTGKASDYSPEAFAVLETSSHPATFSLMCTSRRALCLTRIELHFTVGSGLSWPCSLSSAELSRSLFSGLCGPRI